MTACCNPGASREIAGLVRSLVCTFVSKVLAVLSNHFLNYHHCGAFLSCVCVCVCHRLVNEYWTIVSKLFNNKFVDITLFKTDGPFYIIYCVNPALNSASMEA